MVMKVRIESVVWHLEAKDSDMLDSQVKRIAVTLRRSGPELASEHSEDRWSVHLDTLSGSEETLKLMLTSLNEAKGNYYGGKGD